MFKQVFQGGEENVLLIYFTQRLVYVTNKSHFIVENPSHTDRPNTVTEIKNSVSGTNKDENTSLKYVSFGVFVQA